MKYLFLLLVLTGCLNNNPTIEQQYVKASNEFAYESCRYGSLKTMKLNKLTVDNTKANKICDELMSKFKKGE